MCNEAEPQTKASATHGLSSAESAVHERLVMFSDLPECDQIAYFENLHNAAESAISGDVVEIPEWVETSDDFIKWLKT